MLRWLDRRWLCGIPRSRLTEGMRALGRLALIDNTDDLLFRLRELLAVLISPEAVEAAAATNGINVETTPVRIFIVAGISGGTGGEIVLDIAYAVRQVLGEMNLTPDGICGLMMHLTGQKPIEVELARVNSYAALMELSHYVRGDAPYLGDRAHGLKSFPLGESPFDDCYLVHLGEQLDAAEAESATVVVAEYLYINAAAAIGNYLDEYRQTTRAMPQKFAGLPTVRTVRLSRLHFPKHPLEDAASKLFCRTLLSRWLGEETDHSEEGIKEKSGNQATAMGLEARALNDQFHAIAEGLWQFEPETYFRRIWAEWPQKTTPQQYQASPVDGSNLILSKIRDFLGSRHDCDFGPNPNEPPL